MSVVLISVAFAEDAASGFIAACSGDYPDSFSLQPLPKLAF